MVDQRTAHATSAATLLTAQRHRRGPTVIVRFTGEVDMNSADAMREALSAALAEATAPHPVVVDLIGVGFFGSSGLAELATAHQRAADRHTPLHIVATSRTVLRPLEVTGLATLLTIYRDVTSALAVPHPDPAEGRLAQHGR
jgi:anti-sigma B factor antagonist